MANYRKHVVETRLKYSYSILSQAIKLSEVQNGEYTTWDFPPSGSSWKGQINWLNKYITPYIDILKISYNPNSEQFDKGNDIHTLYPYIILKNGTIIYFHVGNYADFFVDINGLQKPNKKGYDQFAMCLNINNLAGSPKNLFFYGQQHVLNNRTNTMDQCATTQPGFCGAIIQHDGWKIKDDYPYKI